MLKTSHRLELEQSEIASEIIEANFKSLEGDEALEVILYGDQIPRRNDGRLRDGILERYRHLELGGWYCPAGFNPLIGDSSLWGCFKPDNPRPDSSQKKTIKYEHPAKVPTEIFCLAVPPRLAWEIATRYQKEASWLAASTNGVNFWQWVLDTPAIPLVITEGAKKAASVLSHGYAAIALPGIYSGYRTPKDEYGNRTLEPRHLIPQLVAFCQQGREVLFAFDNDPKPRTAKAVRKALSQTGGLMQSQECRVSVMQWGHLEEKGIDDVIVSHGQSVLDGIVTGCLSLDAWRLTEYTDLGNIPRITINSRYLPSDIIPPGHHRLIALKAAKGTGKTEWLAQQVKEALAEDKPVIVLTHREQLGRELAQRYNLPYRSELEFKGDGFNGYVLCADSLHPNANPAFYADRYPDAVVILDEVEQILWHLLNSFTCQYNRPAILESLTALLNGASKVYLSDADLTRISLDYINGLLETPTVPWLLVNEFTSATSRRAVPYESPAALFSDAIESIENGEHLMIHTGAQKVKSTWGTRNIESMLKARFPEKNILRIDAESVADPSHPAYGCMGNLNAVVIQYDIVVASPTLETGVSIDVDHFDRVFCFAVGSQTVEAVLQSLARVRSDVPRHIWAKQYSNHRIGNGSSHPKALLRSQKKLFKTNVNLLAQAETIAAIDGHNVRHLATWSTLAAIHNHGFKTYRNSIYRRLESEGYIITPPDIPDDAEELDNLMKAYADAGHQSECEAIAKAPLLDDVEYEKVSNARAKTEQERHSERKTAISKQYLAQESEITPELVKQDDHGLYGQLQILYYLTIGNEFLADRDHRKVKQLAEQTGKAFTPDVNYRVLSAKVKALQVLDIYQFLDPDQTHTNESLTEWWEQCLQMKWDIKSLIGISINDRMGPMQFAQALLGMMGLKMASNQRRVNGRRVRFYSLPVTPPDDYRQTIMARWLERDNCCHSPSIYNNYGEVA